MAKKITYGMVGGSIQAFIGNVHRSAIGLDSKAELAAGCFSSKPELNAETAEACFVDPSRVYADYKEMAKAEGARPDGIDFVVIVTPNHLHYEVCKEFLNAGINIACEKPLCFEIGQAEELAKLAKEKNLLFAVTYTYMGYTMVKVMREMIQNGDIGEIVSINAEYAQDWMLDQISADSAAEAELPTWRLDPKYSGPANCVGDIGTHIESTVHYVTGLEIKRLLATTNCFGYPLDFNANILLEYENGVNGSYWCTQLASGRSNGLMIRIYGTKGSLEWEQHYPDYVRHTPKNEPPQILSRGSGYITETAHGNSRLPFGHPEGLFVGFANIYRNFVNAVRKVKAGETPTAQDLDFPNVEDGLGGVKFVDAVVASAKNDSSWVTL